MNGFGTHNGWLAFRGWLGAKIYGCDVTWKTTYSNHSFPWHVITVKEREQ